MTTSTKTASMSTNGKLGVCIIALVLAGALAGQAQASTDPSSSAIARSSSLWSDASRSQWPGEHPGFTARPSIAGTPLGALPAQAGRKSAAPAFGINVRSDGKGGRRTSPTQRLADFGRIPWARGPYYGRGADGKGTLPAAFDLTEAKAIAPERRLQVSFKRLPALILNGSYDARIRNYLRTIPAGWTVGVTYEHEPNGDIGTLFSVADFKSAWYRIGKLIKNSPSKATLIPMPNYTGPGGARFEDSWVVDPALMPANSILTWDKYGNPPPPVVNAKPDPLKPYRGLYRTPGKVYEKTMAATKRLGWGDSWGVTEFNAPRRVPADANEVDRRKWFIDAIAYLTSNPEGVAVPKHLFVWEGNGVKFDQNFYTQAIRDALRPYFKRSR